MRIKVAEANGRVLDYLVAVIEKHEWRCSWLLQKEGYTAWMAYERAWGNPHPAYSLDWASGGPIIDREKIAPVLHPLWEGWTVVHPKNAALSILGPTFLTAAMRYFVASRLGDEVEVPQELLSAVP